MKRFWIMLVAVAMALVVALPAGAGKPVKPEKLPTLFDVKFEFTEKVGEEGEEPLNNPGISTDQCTTGGSLTMEAGPGGRLGATGDKGTDVPLLDVDLPDLKWHRYYPYYAQASEVPEDTFNPNNYPLDESKRLEADDLTGCHGAGIDVSVGTNGDISIEDFPRFLMLTVRDGSVDIRWEADYYLVNVETATKNPRKHPTPTVSMNDAMEGFSYSGSLEWAGVWDKTGPSSGLVTGKINVSHFSPGVYEPFPGSPVDVEFTMTITPASE